MSLSQKIEPSDEAWPKRLRDLMHELDWSGERTAKELGVTVTWVSKLRSGKGTFSDAIKRQIGNLERLHLGQLRESTSHTLRDVDATAAYETGGKLENIIRHKIEILLRKAAGNPERLGWISVQIDSHLSPPPGWQVSTDPTENRAVRAAIEEGRRRGFRQAGEAIKEPPPAKKGEQLG